MKCLATIVCISAILLSAGCDQVDRFVERGSNLREAGQYDEALRLYRKAVSASPDNEVAYLEIALTYDEYLKDKSNAVVAYEQYLEVANESVIKERAKEWLSEARSESGTSNLSERIFSDISVEKTDFENEAAERRMELQIKLLKDSLTSRYEGEVEKIRQQLLDAQEKIVTLERENSVYQDDTTYGDETLMLKQMSSNETLIAQLQTELEKQREDSSDVVKGLEMLQSLVTNLQYELQEKTQQAVLFTILNESNSLLTADCQALESRLHLAVNERDEFKGQLDVLKQNSAAASVDSTSGSVRVSPAMQGSFQSLSNTVAELNHKVSLHNRDRDTFVQTVERMRRVIDEKNGKLQQLQDQVDGLKTQTVSQADLKYYRDLITAEKEKRVQTDKMLYERTLQLKRLQQRYASLHQSYLDEAQRRQKVSAYLNQIQNEMNGKSSPGTRTTTRASVTTKRTAVTGTAARRTATRTYTVQQGDSMMKIARKVYGDQNKWTTIFEANRDTLDRPSQLRVGQVLKVP